MRWSRDMASSGRTAVLLLLFFTCFCSLVRAWSTEDHEIFRLKDEIERHDDGKTFYEFMGIAPSASQSDLTKAYRKLSRTLHPDKARSNWLANYNKPPKSSLKPGEKPSVHVHKNKKPSSSEMSRFDKEANARFERLSLVNNLLKGEGRERYDHFLNNGFPAWRGTGYYYERYRPGLGTVLTGLFIFVGGGVHYAALYMGWKRHREFVERYIKHARRMAWGDDTSVGHILGSNIGSGTPASAAAGAGGSNAPADSEESMQWNRRQKRAMDKEKRKESKNPAKSAKAAEKARREGVSTPVEAELISGPVGAKKRTVAENGKILIVDSVGNVFLEDETEDGETQEFLLDPDEIPAPTINDTFLVRGPVFIYNQTLGRVMNKQTPEHIAWEATNETEGETEEAVDGEASLRSAIPPNANGESRKRKIKR